MTNPPEIKDYFEAARIAGLQAELSAEELVQKLNTLHHVIGRGEINSKPMLDAMRNALKQYQLVGSQMMKCLEIAQIAGGTSASGVVTNSRPQ